MVLAWPTDLGIDALTGAPPQPDNPAQALAVIASQSSPTPPPSAPDASYNPPPAAAPQASGQYSPQIERWRGPVTQELQKQGVPLSLNGVDLVDKALHVIQGESGGNPDAVGDGGAAHGLFQSHYVGEGASTSAQIADAVKLIAKNPAQWTDWGEGTTYQGKRFGALGRRAYNGDPGFSANIPDRSNDTGLYGGMQTPDRSNDAGIYGGSSVGGMIASPQMPDQPPSDNFGLPFSQPATDAYASANATGGSAGMQDFSQALAPIAPLSNTPDIDQQAPDTLRQQAIDQGAYNNRTFPIAQRLQNQAGDVGAAIGGVLPDFSVPRNAYDKGISYEDGTQKSPSMNISPRELGRGYAKTFVPASETEFATYGPMMAANIQGLEPLSRLPGAIAGAGRSLLETGGGSIIRNEGEQSAAGLTREAAAGANAAPERSLTSAPAPAPLNPRSPEAVAGVARDEAAAKGARLANIDVAKTEWTTPAEKDAAISSALDTHLGGDTDVTLYRGTNPSRNPLTTSTAADEGPGKWWTTDAKVAEQYAGPNGQVQKAVVKASDLADPEHANPIGGSNSGEWTLSKDLQNRAVVPSETPSIPNAVEPAVAGSQAAEGAVSQGVSAPPAAEPPLSDTERLLQQSLAGKRPAIEAPKTPAAMRQELEAAGVNTEGKTVAQVVSRYRHFASESSTTATPIENVSNVAREAYNKALSQTGDLDAAKLAARKAAAQEGTANARASEMSKLLDQGYHAGINPTNPLGKSDLEKAAEKAINDAFNNLPPDARGDVAAQWPEDYQGVRPDLGGNGDHDAIIEAFKQAIAGKAKTLGPSDITRPLLAKIGGDLKDAYLTEMVHSESGLRHQLIAAGIKDLRPIDLRGLDPEVADVATKNLIEKLKTVQSEANQGVERFREDAINARYKTAAERSAANDTLSARATALAGQQPNVFDKTQAILKEMTLGADLGVTLQQGLKAYRMGSVAALSSGIGHGIEAIGQALGRDPEALGIYTNPAISHEAERAANGLIEGGARAVGLDRGELSGASVIRSPQQAANNLLLPEGENRVASAVKAPVRAVGAGIQKLTDVQYNALNKLRVQIYEGRMYQAKLLGQDTSIGSSAARAAADYANTSTSTARLATDPARALVEKRVMLSPQMTRSQFAELAQPLKTFRSPAEATNTANQLLSTTVAFATALGVAKAFGVDGDAKHFIVNTVNPDSKNFGKIVLKARDNDGNHLVWNFMPQFSAGSAIFKSVRATQALAEGKQDANHALDQVGNALGSFGIGRLNTGFSDLARIGGFGYDQNGQMHWGDMPNDQRVKGSLPVPLSAQQSVLQGQTDPVSIGANILGGNVYGEGTGSVQDRAAQALGAQDYQSAFPKIREKVDADPNVIRAKAQNPTPYQVQSEKAHAPTIADTQRQEALFAQGQNDTSLRDVYKSQRDQFKGIAQTLEPEFAKTFAGFSKTKYDAAVNGYYALGDKAKNEKGDIDFDKLASLQNDYVAKLPADQQQWVKETLQVSEDKKSDTQKGYDKYVAAKKAAGYFDIDPNDPKASQKRSALDMSHANIDEMGWKYGSTTGKPGGALNSPQAVQLALADPFSKNMPVKFQGLDRAINQSPQIQQLWQDQGQRLADYGDTGKLVTKFGNQAAQELYNKPYAQLSLNEQSSALAHIRSGIRDSSPSLQALLIYMGDNIRNNEITVPNDAAVVGALKALQSKYGIAPPKPGVKYVPAKN